MRINSRRGRCKRHAEKRVQERYGANIPIKQLERKAKKLLKRKQSGTERVSEIIDIRIGEQWYKVVFNKALKTIVTVF